MTFALLDGEVRRNRIRISIQVNISYWISGVKGSVVRSVCF